MFYCVWTNSQRVVAIDHAVSSTRQVVISGNFLSYLFLDFIMTNEEPLPKKVSVCFVVGCFFFIFRKTTLIF